MQTVEMTQEALINRLPEPVRSYFEHCRNLSQVHLVQPASQHIMDFNWFGTPQGSDYWVNIYNLLRNIEPEDILDERGNVKKWSERNKHNISENPIKPDIDQI